MKPATKVLLDLLLASYLLLSCSCSVISLQDALRASSLPHVAVRGRVESARGGKGKDRMRWKWILVGTEQEDVFSIALQEAEARAGAGAGAGAGDGRVRIAGLEMKERILEDGNRAMTISSYSGRQAVLSSGRQINVTAFELFVEEELEGKENCLIVLVDRSTNLLGLSAEIKRRIIKLFCNPSSMVMACLTEESIRLVLSFPGVNGSCVVVAQSSSMLCSLAQFPLLHQETRGWSKEGLQSLLRTMLDGWGSVAAAREERGRKGRTSEKLRNIATTQIINKQVEHVNYLLDHVNYLHRSASPVSSPLDELQDSIALKREAEQLYNIFEQTHEKLQKKALKRIHAEQERRAFRMHEESVLAAIEEEAEALPSLRTNQVAEDSSTMSDEHSASSNFYSFPSADV